MFRLALREIFFRKGRSLAVIVGSLLSVLLCTVLIGLVLAKNEAVTTVLESTGAHFIAFKPRCCVIPGLSSEDQALFIAQGNETALLSRKLLNQVDSLPSVRESSPFLEFRVNDNTSSMVVGAFDPDKSLSVAGASCAKTDVVAGRFIKKTDAHSVMLEQSFALVRNLIVGGHVSLWGEDFTIIGIVNPAIRPAKVDVYMTLFDAEKLLEKKTGVAMGNVMNVVLVEALNAGQNRAAMDDVRAVLGSDSLVSGYACYKPASAAMSIETRLAIILLACVFAFVTLLAFTAAYSAVNERQREIGILHTIGWRSLRIVRLVLTESMLRVLIGSGIGFLISLIIFTFFPLDSITGVKIEVNLGLIELSAVVITLLSGLAAGLIAGITAVLKRPVVAIRAA
jgi:putative ABC transport system permease protein